MFGNSGSHIYACIWIFWLAKIAIAQQASIESKAEQINFPPIDPGVIDYLSDHLESTECAQLCTFLALQNANSLSRVSNNFKNSWGGGGGRSRTAGPINFPCQHTLKLWNDNVAATEAEGRFDGTEYIENQVIFGLKQVNRKDLAGWLENLRAQKRHSEILQMENEWAQRKLHSETDLPDSEGNDDKMQSGSGISKSEEQNNMDMNMTANLNLKLETSSLENDNSFFDEDQEIDIENDIPSPMYAVIMFAVGGVFCITIIAITVWCCSRRQPPAIRYKPRKTSWTGTGIDEVQQRLKSGSPDHRSSVYGLHVDV